LFSSFLAVTTLTDEDVTTRLEWTALNSPALIPEDKAAEAAEGEDVVETTWPFNVTEPEEIELKVIA